MTKWIFLVMTFMILTSLTEASTQHPVLRFLEKNKISHPINFEFVFNCNQKTNICFLTGSDIKNRELQGRSASEAQALIQVLKREPVGVYISCRKNSCRSGNVPDVFI